MQYSMCPVYSVTRIQYVYDCAEERTYAPVFDAVVLLAYLYKLFYVIMRYTLYLVGCFSTAKVQLPICGEKISRQKCNARLVKLKQYPGSALRLYFHHYHYARVAYTNNSTRFIRRAQTQPRGNVHSFLLSDVLRGKFVCSPLLHHSKQYYILYVATMRLSTYIHFTPPARALPPSHDTVPQTAKRNNRPAHHVNVWSSTYCITHLIFLSPKDFSTMLFNVK